MRKEPGVGKKVNMAPAPEKLLVPFSLYHDVFQSHKRAHKFTKDNITELNSDT